MSDEDVQEQNEIGFRKLSRVLSICRFEHPLDPDLAKLAQRPPGNRNCYFLGNRWLVKYYYGGKQRLWASIGLHGCAEACRIADMIILRFAPKKFRNKGEPITDESLNLTLAQAKLDLERESEIVSILCQMDACVGDITAPVRRSGAKHKTQHAEFARWAKTVDLRLNEILDKITGVEGRIAEMRRGIPPPPPFPIFVPPPTIIRDPNTNPVIITSKKELSESALGDIVPSPE